MTPIDDIIGPVVAHLASNISTQIDGLGRMYPEVPDGPPESNSVIFPCTGFKFGSENTNGKMSVTLKISVRYMVRRTKFADNVQQCYLMFSPFAKVLSSIPNQTLSGDSITVTPKDGGVSILGESMQPFVALIINTEVLTEFNILQS